MDSFPKKEQFKEAVSDIVNDSVFPKMIQLQSSITEVDNHVKDNETHIMDSVKKLSDKIDNLNTNMSQEFHKTQESYNSIKRFIVLKNCTPLIKMNIIILIQENEKP
jgi:hypothetical protein